MFPKCSIGINFSNTHAFIVCMEKNLSGIRVKKHALVDFQKSITLAEQLESLEPYLVDFIKTNKISDPDIYIGFPRELSIVRQLEFPLSVKEDLFSTIKYSLEKFIPLKTEDVYFDCSVLLENKEKKTITALLGAGKKKDLKPFVDFAVSLDSGVAGIQIISTAIADFILNGSDPSVKADENLFLCHGDGKILDVIFFKKGKFVYSKYLQMDDGKDVFELMNAEIQHTCQHQTKPSEISLVICGTGFDDPSQKEFDKELTITVRDHGFKNYNLPSEEFLPAASLAMGSFGKKSAFQLNLLPESRRKKVSKTATYLMYLLICISIVLGIAWGGSFVIKERIVLSRYDSELLRLGNEVAQINESKAEISDLESRMEIINRLRQEQVFVSDILDELSEIIPSESWIKGFSFNMEKGIRINGFSDQASDLIPLIEESERFENCVFLSAITKGADGKEKFLIGFDVKKD